MIAIKDMEMPKSCAKCKLCEYSEHIGYYCVANNGGKFTMTREEMKEKRLDNCPLVEIITCKDCKYYRVEDDDEYCTNHTIKDNKFWVREDFFCKDGERRE